MKELLLSSAAVVPHRRISFPENMLFIRKLRPDELSKDENHLTIYIACTASGKFMASDYTFETLFNQARGNDYQPVWMH